METLKFNVFNFLNKSKETTVPLLLLCPTFRYSFLGLVGKTKWSCNSNWLQLQLEKQLIASLSLLWKPCFQP